MSKLAVLAAGALALGGCAINSAPLAGRPFHDESLRRIDTADYQVNKGAGPFSFGTATADMTPPLDMPMAGYGGLTSRRSTGTHDPIQAKAFALSDGNDIAVMVSADTLIINEALEAEVMRRIRKQGLDLRDEQVMISATHTHAGPGGYGSLLLEQLVMGGYTERMRDYLAEGIARAAVTAVKSLKPGAVAFGRINEPDCITNRVHEDGTNPRLDVMVCKAQDGSTAWLVNYSAHPTCLSSDNHEYSADYPGVLCRELATDGSFAMFTAGTIGGQRPGKDGNKELAACEWVGKKLAADARTAMKGAAFKDRVDIRTLESTFELPPTQMRLTPISNYICLPQFLGYALAPKDRSKVQFLAIDDRLFYGTPCDMGWDVGQALISQAAKDGFDATIVSQCEGYVGYICREERYWKGAYEGLMSFHGPHMDQYFKDLLGRATRKLK